MSSSGRVDFLGIDNATLDFSQLEDYINDEEDPNESIYFNDNLVTGDLKLPDSPHSVNHLKLPTGHLNLGTNNITGGGRLPGEAVQQSQVSSSQSSVAKGNIASIARISSVTTLTVSGGGNGGGSVNSPNLRPSSVQINQGSNLPIDQPGSGHNSNNGNVTNGETEVSPTIHHLTQIQANHQHLQHHHHQQQQQHPHPHLHQQQQQQQQQPSHHQQQQQHHLSHSHPHPHHSHQQLQHHQHHQPQPQHQHHQSFTSFNKHPHHLPESPPDSGSEPPYSPPNDENRMNNSNQVILGSTLTNNNSQSSHQNSNSKMIQSNSIDKHFNHYNSNTIKLLPNTDINGLTLPPNHIQSPRSGSIGGGQLNNLHGLNGQIQGHPDESILNHHLGQSLITGPINLQSPSIISGLSPLSSTGQPHLTTLYPGGGTNGSRDCIETIDIPGQSAQLTNGQQQQQQNDHHQQSTGSMGQNGGQNKKRRHSESPKNVANNVHVKQEPGGGISPEPGNRGSIGGTVMVSMEEEYGFDYNTNTEGPPSVYLDSAYQCIRFQIFQQSAWHTLCDASLKDLPVPNYRVDADKGFNFSNADDAFVCQKKNHFQVTVHVQPIGDPQFVKTPDSVRKVDNFYLHFYGVKVESPSQTIKVEQSQSDRSKKPFHPVLIELCPDQVSKTTVGRLHFSETTSNNMRKKGKPNPDQRYFYLVVSLCAHVGDQSYPIVSHASERIIVRASNPGQFENDMELSWQKGQSPESIYHAGRVGINTDRPDEPLVVHGNVKVTGHIVQPSDLRAKTNIEEISTREQLQNVANIRVVRYQFTPEFAQQVGLKDEDINGTGIIAQEVQKILPDAIKETGDVILPSGERIEKLLVVNKERIFMENVGAVKELCKVTDNLETRIDELERMNRKLRRINRFDSIKSILSSTSSVTSASTVTCISNYSGLPNNKRLACKLTHPYDNNQPQQLQFQQQQRRKCSKHTNNNNGNNQEDNQVCTNRFMQSIIMILVLIMAFCLASIVTLYILDYPRHHNNQLNQPHHKVDHQYQHNQFILNNNNSQSSSSSSSSSQHQPSYSYLSSTSPSTVTINSYHNNNNRKQSIDSFSKSSLLPSHSVINSDQKKVQPIIDTQRRTDNLKPSRPTSIPILKPRELGQIVGCPSSGQEMVTLSSCNVHCCLENDGHAELNIPVIDEADGDSSGSSSYETSSHSDKINFRSPKEIETETKSKDILREEDENSKKEKKTSSSSFISSPPPSSSSSSSTTTSPPSPKPQRYPSKEETLSPSVSTLIVSSTPLNPKSPVTSSIKLTGESNHVSEEISSRANHGRYLTSDFGPSSSISSVNNIIAPGIETGSHINNLAVDNNFNYSTIEVANLSNKTLDPIEQHLNAKVDSFSSDKFVSYNSHQPPSSILYSKTSTEYREKRETREGHITRQDPRDKYQTGSPGSPADWIDSIKLLELNATIGREFCDTWQCVQQEGPLLTYLIPISKYMSHEYVTLQFSLTSALKVDNCEYNERPTSCPSLPPGSVPHTYHRPSEHLPIAESNPSFRIPIGLYLRSTYVFRVLAKDRNTETPCSLSSSELGSSYLEIRLKFNRLCEA